jgi:hypothetical protein
VVLAAIVLARQWQRSGLAAALFTLAGLLRWRRRLLAWRRAPRFTLDTERNGGALLLIEVGLGVQVPDPVVIHWAGEEGD